MEGHVLALLLLAQSPGFPAPPIFLPWLLMPWLPLALMPSPAAAVLDDMLQPCQELLLLLLLNECVSFCVLHRLPPHLMSRPLMTSGPWRMANTYTQDPARKASTNRLLGCMRKEPATHSSTTMR